jgi:hypothetical protein
VVGQPLKELGVVAPPLERLVVDIFVGLLTKRLAVWNAKL